MQKFNVSRKRLFLKTFVIIKQTYGIILFIFQVIMSLYKSTNARKLFPRVLNTCPDNGEDKEATLIECKTIVRAIIAPFERAH